MEEGFYHALIGLIDHELFGKAFFWQQHCSIRLILYAASKRAAPRETGRIVEPMNEPFSLLNWSKSSESQSDSFLERIIPKKGTPENIRMARIVMFLLWKKDL